MKIIIDILERTLTKEKREKPKPLIPYYNGYIGEIKQGKEAY